MPDRWPRPRYRVSEAAGRAAAIVDQLQLDTPGHRPDWAQLLEALQDDPEILDEVAVKACTFVDAQTLGCVLTAIRGRARRQAREAAGA